MFTKIWIETHVHRCAELLILPKSLFSSIPQLSTSCTAENNEALTANNLALDDNSSASSFIYIKNNNGLSIEPFDTPALTLVHVGTCPFKTTLCFLFRKKPHNKLKSLLGVPFCFI